MLGPAIGSFAMIVGRGSALTGGSLSTTGDGGVKIYVQVNGHSERL